MSPSNISNASINLTNQSTPTSAIDPKQLRTNISSLARQSNPTYDHQKRRSLHLNYGTQMQDDENDMLRPMQQKLNELIKDEHFNRSNSDQFASNAETENHDHTIVVQMEKDNLDLRRELQDTRASKKLADKKIQE